MHGNIRKLFMFSEKFMFSEFLFVLFKQQLAGICCFQAFLKSPHHLCRFVPLGRSGSDHWCFSCCLPGGEWRKGPNGNIGHGDDRERHRQSGHFLCVEMKDLCEWIHSTVFLTGKNLQQKKWDLKRTNWSCKSHHFLQFGARVQLCLWFNGKFLVTSKTAWDDQFQPSEKDCPSWPKRIPTVGFLWHPRISVRLSFMQNNRRWRNDCCNMDSS